MITSHRIVQKHLRNCESILSKADQLALSNRKLLLHLAQSQLRTAQIDQHLRLLHATLLRSLKQQLQPVSVGIQITMGHIHPHAGHTGLKHLLQNLNLTASRSKCTIILHRDPLSYQK